MLLRIGRWLVVNGEAFFGTTPWMTYGEGPTQMKKSGGFMEDEEVRYTPQAIRSTTKGIANKPRSTAAAECRIGSPWPVAMISAS